jgi:5-methylcytosine-specific restriction endonuclease McrA
VSLEQAVLFLCERGMAHEIAYETDADRRDESFRAQIVYQHCPDCKKARVGTRDGFVEVAAEEVARYEGSAERVVIDGPTPPGLRRGILAREAGRCANPRCDHRADHCHHIVLRSRGGRTEMANEVAVCVTCHALIHAGLLRVSGRADGALGWSPVAPDDSLAREVASGAAVADRLPVLQLEPRESAIADSPCEHAPDLDDLAHGLMRLGVPAVRSRRMIDAAVGSLPRGEITEASVLRRAIASI